MAAFISVGRTAPVALAAALLLLTGLSPALAQSLIRDAEIEHSLNELALPILNAAGLSPESVKILVLDDQRLNAFVIDGKHIFINSGLIRKLERPEMLQAVIAHEAAHIVNGHITRRVANARNARTAAGLGLLLSGMVAATGNAQAAVGLAIGSGSTARRLFLAHTRGEESSADQSAAHYMAQAGVDVSAMVEVLEIFKGQEALATERRDPYALTHPLSADRLRAAHSYAAAHAAQGDGDADSDYWFARARGKLDAFLGDPRRTIRRLRGAEADSVTLMKRAVAYLRMPDFGEAIENVNTLARLRPDDPYVQELKGQIHHESGRFKEAMAAYARAVELAPRDPLILAGYGRALLASDTAADNRKALEVLERARAGDKFQPRMLRDLALAHARLGDNGMASLATAERYALLGRTSDAVVHAKRASDLLAPGSPGWNRAQDVLNAAKP